MSDIMVQPKNVKELVGVLKTYFNDPEILWSDRSAAWKLLTALRGPDNLYEIPDDARGEYHQAKDTVRKRKLQVTARIRWALFGKGAVGDITSNPWPVGGIGKIHKEDLRHWYDHSVEAYSVLRELGLLNKRKGAKKR